MTDGGQNAAARSSLVLVVATALMLLGLVAVATSTASLDRPLFGAGFLGTVLGRQVVFVLAGLVIMAVTSRLAAGRLRSRPLRLWGAGLLFVLTLGGLVAALVPGIASSQGGSQRWLRFVVGGFQLGLQPSELAKVALVLLLASMLTRRGVDPRSLREGFLPASVAIGVIVLLVGMEDFGTAVLLAAAGGAMLLAAGCRFRDLAVLGVVGVMGLTVLLFAEPYRLERIAAYLDFGGDPQGAGYQPLQSLATIASGGWLGTGLGLGVQKYGYLPASHTDFIFAVICEEMGVLGGMAVLALFALLVWLGLRTMQAASSDFERLLAFGLTATLGLQTVMNVAVVTALVPTTGISLPLVSVGGSGVLTYSFALGLLAAIARMTERGVTVPQRGLHHSLALEGVP